MKMTKIDIKKTPIDIESDNSPVVYFYEFDDKTYFCKTPDKIKAVDCEIKAVPYKKLYIKTLGDLTEALLVKPEDEHYIKTLLKIDKQNVIFQILFALQKQKNRIKKLSWWKRLFNKF